MNLENEASLSSLLDMEPFSPSLHAQASESSPGCKPMAIDPSSMTLPKAGATAEATAANADCPLLRLPDDVFKCVMDHLPRSAALSLRRVCKGLSSSVTVNHALYKYPIQLHEVQEIRLSDWNHRSIGQMRWQKFKDSISDANRNFVQRIAMSHWASIDDFRWLEENLPSLTSLDLSSIKDFVWTPEETWTWKMLAEACPKLFGRLEELEVANWVDYSAHARIEYNYSYNDYRFRQEFRMSRRRDGGTIAKMIFPTCKKLKLLAIRERHSGFHTWNEWEVHQRVCCLIDGIEKYCAETMTQLRIHDYTPYRALFSTGVTDWSRLTSVEIALSSWMEDRQDRETLGPTPHRIIRGPHHREEEKDFHDNSFASCKRNHVDLGNNVIRNAGTSFEDLIQNLQTICNKYPRINMRPMHSLGNSSLHPFNFVSIMRRRNAFTPATNNQVPVDPITNELVQRGLHWLRQKCAWRPILSWDNMMCDVFPANLEPNGGMLPKADIMSRIHTMVATLRRLDIPIRISIGDRTNTCPTSGMGGSIYFGDYKTMIGQNEDRYEVLLPTQASFNLTTIADMVDELIIQYPIGIPGVSSWLRSAKHPTPAEEVVLQREIIGWRRFWKRYSSLFKNLKKLTVDVPTVIYNDWGKSELLTLLSDERWDMLKLDKDPNPIFLSSHSSFGTPSRRRGPCNFVQRVFFRLDDKPLELQDAHSEHVSALEREEGEITDEQIKDIDRPQHRFWLCDPADDLSKRKRANDLSNEHEDLEMKRLRVEEAGRFVHQFTLAHIHRTFERFGGF